MFSLKTPTKIPKDIFTGDVALNYEAAKEENEITTQEEAIKTVNLILNSEKVEYHLLPFKYFTKKL